MHSLRQASSPPPFSASPRLLFNIFFFRCPMNVNPHETPQSHKNHPFGEAEDRTKVNSKPWFSYRLRDGSFISTAILGIISVGCNPLGS